MGLLPGLSRHALILILLLGSFALFGPGTRVGAASPPPPPTRGPSSRPTDRAALATACDDLIGSAVRTPFGWGWAAVEPQADAPHPEVAKPARGKPKPAAPAAHKPVPIDSAETAVLGLELYWAGQALGEPKYEAAAFEAAHGIVSLQARTGQIRTQGLLGGGGPVQTQSTDVPDRAPTRAALALLLTLIDADRPPADAPPKRARDRAAEDGSAGDGAEGREDRRWAERLRGPAGHAAHWLASQQAASGVWPTAYPPDAPPGKAFKVVRLDSSDYRDNVCSLLLAGEVLDSPHLRQLADHALDGLLALRIANWRGTRGLWVSANNLEGDVPRKFPELNHGYDLLATRYAMQAMLASYLVTLQPKGNDALADSAKMIAGLPKQEEKWVRFYSWRGERASSLPEAEPDTPFRAGRPAVDDGSGNAFGLMPTLDALTQINAVGGKRYADFLAATHPLNARLAEQICGLSDDALGLRLPRQPGADAGAGEAAGAGEEAGKSDKPAADQAPPTSNPEAPGISDRAARLWQLLRKFMADAGRP